MDAVQSYCGSLALKKTKLSDENAHEGGEIELIAQVPHINHVHHTQPKHKK